MNITSNERAGLQGIIDSQYYDPGFPAGLVWTWSANPFPNPRTFSGVVASLKQKGLVTLSQGRVPDENCISITEAGLAVLAQ